MNHMAKNTLIIAEYKDAFFIPILSNGIVNNLRTAVIVNNKNKNAYNLLLTTGIDSQIDLHSKINMKLRI